MTNDLSEIGTNKRKALQTLVLDRAAAILHTGISVEEALVRLDGSF